MYVCLVKIAAIHHIHSSHHKTIHTTQDSRSIMKFNAKHDTQMTHFSVQSIAFRFVIRRNFFTHAFFTFKWQNYLIDRRKREKNQIQIQTRQQHTTKAKKQIKSNRMNETKLQMENKQFSVWSDNYGVRSRVLWLRKGVSSAYVLQIIIIAMQLTLLPVHERARFTFCRYRAYRTRIIRLANSSWNECARRRHRYQCIQSDARLKIT